GHTLQEPPTDSACPTTRSLQCGETSNAPRNRGYYNNAGDRLLALFSQAVVISRTRYIREVHRGHTDDHDPRGCPLLIRHSGLALRVATLCHPSSSRPCPSRGRLQSLENPAIYPRDAG